MRSPNKNTPARIQQGTTGSPSGVLCPKIRSAVPSFEPDRWSRTVRHLTEAAARACGPWIGRADKDAADAAAVAALRDTAAAASLRGEIVIGEGEKDDAPYLAPGSQIGEGTGAPRVDVAVDPLEGTQLVATEAPGALSVMALAPSDSMMPLGRAFYVEKLIGPPAARDALALDAPPRRVVHRVADALDVPPTDLRVAVQDRPRHAALVEALRTAGAQVRLFGDGDLSFALLALQDRSATERPPDGPERPVDLLWGIGGAPEGMLAAAAQRAIGGAMRLRLAPRSVDERARLYDDPALPSVLSRTFAAAELVQTESVAMALTGVTDGPLLTGLRTTPDAQHTETLVLTPSRPPDRVVTPHERPR